MKKNELRMKLEQTKEFHVYPKAQHTPKGSKPEPLMNDKVDFVAAIKSGAVIGYVDICMLGIPKSAFRSLQTALKGAEYSPYTRGSDLVVVDKMYYTTKHLEADQAGLPCIDFDEVLVQLYESKDPAVKKFLQNDGKIIMNQIEMLLGKEESVQAPAKKEWSWLKK